MIPLPTEKYGTTRCCSDCQRTLPLAMFNRKFGRHRNGQVVVSRTCRSCRRRRRHVMPAYRRALAFMADVRSRPCTCCGQRVHPDATILVPPAGERHSVSSEVGNVSLARLRARVARSTLLCANCYQVKRVAARRATAKNPVRLVRVDTSMVRAAVEAQKRVPDLADVPPASPLSELLPSPTHSLTDSTQQGRGEATPKSVGDNAS